MVATVKSLVSIAALAPLGSLTWLMWIESPISSPSRSMWISSGISERVADQREVVDDDVEHAAALQARRSFFIVEADRHVDVDLAVLADAQEIDMDRAAGDRVELHCLGQGAVRLAVRLRP